MTPHKLKRILQFHPGHNCIDYKCKWGKERCLPGEGGSHGIHGMEIAFYVKGDDGAIVFRFAICDMIPGRVLDSEGGSFKSERTYRTVMAMDLRYHSLRPMYEDQKPMDSECEWVKGGKCYYDGSTLNADTPLAILTEHGDEEVWLYLEQFYECTFNDSEWPAPPLTKLVPR